MTVLYYVLYVALRIFRRPSESSHWEIRTCYLTSLSCIQRSKCAVVIALLGWLVSEFQRIDAHIIINSRYNSARACRWLKMTFLSGGDIYWTFRNEIVPSFCPGDFNDISTWIKFVNEVLEVEVGEMNPKVCTDAQIRNHWNATLMLWLDKVKNSGKSNMENEDESKWNAQKLECERWTICIRYLGKELQAKIRLKAQEFREYR